jgi:hypothetical protein
MNQIDRSVLDDEFHRDGRVAILEICHYAVQMAFADTGRPMQAQASADCGDVAPAAS